MWWKTPLGAPVALFLCLIGLITHPLQCIEEYIHYSEMMKDSQFPVGRWTNFVRACTDIDMCT